MKSLGYTPDDDDMSQMEEHEYYSGLIIKNGSRCFFCNQDCHFGMDRPLFWETAKNQIRPKHKLALADVENARNRQAECDLQNKEVINNELLTKSVKAMTEERVGAIRRRQKTQPTK